MGLTVMLSGGGYYSIDNLLAQRNPSLKTKKWFVYAFSGLIGDRIVKKYALMFGVFAITFTVGFYIYLHGAVFGPVTHRTSPTKHHVSLNQAHIENNHLLVNAYVDAGPDTQGAFITNIQITEAQSKVVIDEWHCEGLSQLLLQPNFVNNHYPFSQFTKTHCGFMGDTGSKAQFQIPISMSQLKANTQYNLTFVGIQGQRWGTSFSFN